jgi:hypothetical protein
MGGVVQVSAAPPFHAPVQYYTFPSTQTTHKIEYCEIFRTHGHAPRHFPILQKYTPAPNTIHCKFFGSTMHATNQCRELDVLVDRLDQTAFRVNETTQGPGKEVEEVGVEVDLEEGGMEEEDQVDATIVMNKETWLETFLTQDDHGVHTTELMFMQPKIAQT